MEPIYLPLRHPCSEAKPDRVIVKKEDGKAAKRRKKKSRSWWFREKKRNWCLQWEGKSLRSNLNLKKKTWTDGGIQKNCIVVKDVSRLTSPHVK